MAKQWPQNSEENETTVTKPDTRKTIVGTSFLTKSQNGQRSNHHLIIIDYVTPRWPKAPRTESN